MHFISFVQSLKQNQNKVFFCFYLYSMWFFFQFVVSLKKIGALTSKVFAFKARPWETDLVKSIDISDNLGCLVSVETKDAKILRVLPRYSHHLQLDWCGDKARFIHETNDKHRLAISSTLNQKGRYQALKSLLHQKKVATALLASYFHLDYVLGRQLDNSTIYKAKRSARLLGADCLSEFSNNLLQSFAFSYASTAKIKDLDLFDSIFFLGVNPRWETTIANLLVRFRYLSGDFKVKSIGNSVDLTYRSENFGSKFSFLHIISIGKASTNQFLTEKALFAFGDSLSQRADAASIQKYGSISHHLKVIKSIYLSTGVNIVGLSHLGFHKWKEKNATYFVGAEDSRSFDLVKNQNHVCETSFVHKSIKKASYLQPLQTYLEKNVNYMRYDGVVQTAYKAFNLGVDALQSIRKVSTSMKAKTSFSAFKYAKKAKYFLNIHTCDVFQALCAKEKALKTRLTCVKSFYGNLYQSSSFLNTSPTLLQLTKLQKKLHWPFIQVF